MAVTWEITSVVKQDDGSYLATATRTETDDTTGGVIHQNSFSGPYYPGTGTDELKQRLIQAVQALKAKRADEEAAKATLQADLDAAVPEIEA
jgi:hypothetical protein